MIWIALALALIPRGMQIHVINRDGTWSEGPNVIVESAGYPPMHARLSDNGVAPDMRAGDAVWTASVPDTPEGVFSVALLAPTGQLTLDAEVDTTRAEISLDIEFAGGRLTRQTAAKASSPFGSPSTQVGGSSPEAGLKDDLGYSWVFWSALIFGIGLGTPLALTRRRRQPPLLRGQWPMRRSSGAPPAGRPIYVIGEDGVHDVLGDEAVRAASALGPTTILHVRDEQALARRDDRPAIQAFIEDVDGRLEVWVTDADGTAQSPASALQGPTASANKSGA